MVMKNPPVDSRGECVALGFVLTQFAADRIVKKHRMQQQVPFSSEIPAMDQK
jgi:hypothetical protein